MSDIFRTAASAVLAGLATAAQAGAGELELQLTVGTDLSDGACAETTAIEVGYGDQVNLCYRVVNHSDRTLRYHVLRDDAVGRLLTLAEIEMPPGGSHQVNRIAAANETRTVGAHWQALESAPAYDVEASDPAVIFADGFDGEDRIQFGFVDISATGEEFIIPSEWVPLQLPFEFDFYGIVSDRIRFVEYGAIGWDPIDRESNNIRYLPQNILDSLGPGLYPYWTNMYNSGGRFFHRSMGEAPNRRLVLQWHEVHYNRGHFPESGTATFQLVLEEGTNRIWFNYLDAAFGDPAYDYARAGTVGIGAGAGGFRLQYSRLEASLADHFTLRFTPDPVARMAASASVAIDVGAPVVKVEPAQLNATLAAGSTGSAILSIGNEGTRDLVWSLAEAPARMHFPSTRRVTVPGHIPGNGAPIGGPAARFDHATGMVSPAGVQVPAYAWADTALESFVRFDAAAPEGSLIEIDGSVRRFLLGGDFIGHDFSAFYALDWWTNQLVRMLTENCFCIEQVVVVGPPGNPAGGPRPRLGNWNGMSYDSSNDRLYAVAGSILYRIDLATVKEWELGEITGVPGNDFGGTRIEDIAVSPEGLMYGVEALGDNLVAIDKVTGEAAIIGPLGIDLPSGFRPPIALDFDDATGTLYLVANGNIYTVDTATGWARIVGGTGESPLDALAIATTSPCEQPEDIPWLSFGDEGGMNAPGEWSTLAVGFDASGMAPGEYTANVCVANNDPLHGRVIAPVTMIVE